MNRLFSAFLALASFVILSSAREATAEPHRFESVRVADIPRVEAEPKVAWARSPKFNSDGLPFPLPDVERSRPAADYHELPRPSMTNGKGNAAVIRTRNLFYPARPFEFQYTRYLQSDDASPIAFLCGNDWGGPRGVDAYLLEGSRAEGPRYTYVESWLDATPCTGLALRGYTTAVRSLAGGLVHVYRTSCAACAPAERETLHVVIPSTTDSSVTGEGSVFRYWTYLMAHVELPLGRGTAGSMRASIEKATVQSWNRVVPSPMPVEHVDLSIETSFASGEEEPTIVVATR